MPRQRSNAFSGGQVPFIGAKPSKTPTIGSHRTRSPIGGHRSPHQMLSLQQSLGNQSTQQLQPKQEPPVTNDYTETSVSSSPVSYGYSNAYSSIPTRDSLVQGTQTMTEGGAAYGTWSSGGGTDVDDSYSYDDDKTDYEDVDSESSPTIDSVVQGTQTMTEGGTSYSSNNYGKWQHGGSDVDDSYSYDDDDKTFYDDVDGSVSTAPSVSKSAPTAKRVSESGFVMESNKEEHFDKNVVSKGTVSGVDLDSTTFYAGEEQRKKYGRGFDESGKMVNSSDSSSLNTIGASKAAAKGSKPNRHIFVMDEKGGFYSNDAIKENSDRSKAIKDKRKQDIKDLKDKPEEQEKLKNQMLPNMERFHHTSFLAGQDVAGAGELQVRDGQVELVSDASGHYKPESRQMIQTVQQLEKNKVPIEQLGVEFIGKPQFEHELDMNTLEPRIDPTIGKKVIKTDSNGNKVKKLDRNGQQVMSKNMQASAMELLGYSNFAPDAAEERMRDMHDKKDSVLQELLSKTKRVEPIAYDHRGQTQDNHSNVMQELLSKTKRAEPIPDLPEEKFFGNNPIPNLNVSDKNVSSEDDYSYDYDDEKSGGHEIAIDRGYSDGSIDDVFASDKNVSSGDDYSYDYDDEKSGGHEVAIDRGYSDGSIDDVFASEDFGDITIQDYSSIEDGGSIVNDEKKQEEFTVADYSSY